MPIGRIERVLIARLHEEAESQNLDGITAIYLVARRFLETGVMSKSAANRVMKVADSLSEKIQEPGETYE